MKRYLLLLIIMLPIVFANELSESSQSAVNISFESLFTVIPEQDSYYVNDMSIIIEGFPKDVPYQTVTEFNVYPAYIRNADSLYFVWPEFYELEAEVGYYSNLLSSYYLPNLPGDEIFGHAYNISKKDILVEEKMWEFVNYCSSREIPLRYVYGYRYSDSWKSHLWLEAQLNGVWIPFDFVKEVFGYYEPDIFSLKHASEEDDIMLRYSAESMNATLSNDAPYTIVSTVSYKEKRDLAVQIIPHLYLEKCGFGSYNVAEVIINNRDNKRVPLIFEIIAPEQVSLGLSDKFILMEPDSVQRFYVPFNIAKNLDRDKTYRFSLVLRVNHHWEIPVNFSADQYSEKADEELIDGIIANGIHVISSELDEDTVEGILNKAGEENVEETIEKYQETKDSLNIKKQRKDDTVNILIEPDKKMYNISIYENIPKCLAEHIDRIIFENTNVTVLNADPLVMWHFDEVGEDIDLSYSLADFDIDDCENESLTLAVAQEISDQYLVSRVPWKQFLPFAILVAVVSVVVYFFKFTPSKMTSELEAHVINLAGYIKKQVHLGQDLEFIEKQLLNVGWPKHIIKKSFKMAEKEIKEIQKFIKGKNPDYNKKR